MENTVGYVRRNYFVPIPSTASLGVASRSHNRTGFWLRISCRQNCAISRRISLRSMLCPSRSGQKCIVAAQIRPRLAWCIEPVMGDSGGNQGFLVIKPGKSS